MEEFFGTLKHPEGREVLQCLHAVANRLMPPPEIPVYHSSREDALGTYQPNDRYVQMHMPGLKRAAVALLPSWDPKPSKEETIKTTYGVIAYCLCHELAHAAYYTRDAVPPSYAEWDKLDGPILRTDIAHRLAVIRGSEGPLMPCRPSKDESEYEIKMAHRERYLAGDHKAIMDNYGPKLAGRVKPENIEKQLGHFGAGEFIAHIGGLTTMLIAAPELVKIGPLGKEMAKEILAMGKGMAQALDALPPDEQKQLRKTIDDIHSRLGWTTPPSAVIGNQEYLQELEQALDLEVAELAI